MAKHLPLRKCLQCKRMKREDFHDRCRACYDENNRECQRQRETAPLFPLDRNLIEWVNATSIPYPHDYLWYFLKWCIAQWKQRTHQEWPSSQQSNRALLTLMKSIEARSTTESIEGETPPMKPVARYYPGEDRWEFAPYPQTDTGEPMAMECEVRYD